MTEQKIATLKPEERARVWIDRKLERAGWKVINRDEYCGELSAVAIREALMKGNKEADYLLMLNGKACAVLEAKRAEVSLDNPSLIDQAENYTRILPDWVAAFERPLQLVLLSNGKKIAFRNGHSKDPKYELRDEFPRPKDIARILRLEDRFSGLPTLSKAGLRECQYEAITSFEKSLRAGKKRALMVLATGAGKTYTACLAAYRMLNYCRAKRVLFLVDRTNLGVQAEIEFSNFKRTENGKRFSDNYVVERLTSPKISHSSELVISTIQRLFSVLTGREDEKFIEDEAHDSAQIDHDVKVPENPKLPKDFFDLIIVDECHRSIYGEWQDVLTYFDQAVILGLTATPVEATEQFFNKNVVVEYSLEESIDDLVNVYCRTYNIRTEITENGATVNSGESIQEESRANNSVTTTIVGEAKKFSKSEIGRSVIVPDQIRKVLTRYKDIVYTQLYPKRTDNEQFDSLPKTLIFAASEAHAREIVKIAKEVFGRTDDKFVQQITYSVGDSDKLIRSFRNDKDFRIAVTVTLVATGTDVKPLEVLIFMNDVHSETLYQQMKGRGVRTISSDKLREVTPNAITKDFFYLIDAVGVTESEKRNSSPAELVVDDEYSFNLSFKDLFEKLSHGNVQDKYLKVLAEKLRTLVTKADPEKIEELNALFNLKHFVRRIFNTLEKEYLPPFEPIDGSNTHCNSERRNLVHPLLSNNLARNKIIEIARGYIKYLLGATDIIDETETGFDEDIAVRAKTATEQLEDYIERNRDRQEALRIILDNRSEEPITKEMLQGLETAIKSEVEGFTTSKWWGYYAYLNPDNVTLFKTTDEVTALTNLIQLVRYAYRSIEKLCSVPSMCSRLFNLWCGQAQRTLTPRQKELFTSVARYIAQNGAVTTINVFRKNPALRDGLKAAMGSMDAANDAVLGLSNFLLNRKIA